MKLSQMGTFQETLQWSEIFALVEITVFAYL